jgi:hypothetical protein
MTKHLIQNLHISAIISFVSSLTRLLSTAGWLVDDILGVKLLHAKAVGED